MKMFGFGKSKSIKELEQAKKLLERQRLETQILVERMEIEKEIQTEKNKASEMIALLKNPTLLMQHQEPLNEQIQFYQPQNLNTQMPISNQNVQTHQARQRIQVQRKR